MDLIDFQNRTVQLPEAAWEHIQERHPEIEVEDIALALLDPDVVQLDEFSKPKSNCSDELFFQKRISHRNKDRFLLVVVRVCDNGNFISSSYICRRLKKFKVIFSKET